MDTDTLFLLCLQDMDKMGIFFNNITNQIIFPGGSYPVVRAYSHPFLVWGSKTVSAYLTEPELCQLHRRFGYPTVERLT
jgi:hypothetical protein